MALPPADDAFRRQVLQDAGAQGATIDELLAYGANVFAGHPGLSGSGLPLADEPQITAWADYAADAARDGAFAALARRFPQLRFPIEAGISQQPRYRQATRRGIVPWDAPGLLLRDPDGLTLRLHPTPAGRVPVIVARERADFVTLVRAFTSRNEPEPVPDSMGACIVRGLSNWDRIARHRALFEQALDRPADEAEWAAEFERLVPQKELYQDRFILLSSGPYSALSAQEAGLPEAEWRRQSVEIRCEHECTHYFTSRVLGSMRNNAHDELLADCAGLLAARGRYEPRLALAFLGLEHHPRYRSGGRLESYLGKPPLTEAAFGVLRELVHRAIGHLGALVAARPGLAAPEARSRLVLALAASSLEELAASDAGARLLAAPAFAVALSASRSRFEVRVPATDAGLQRVLRRFDAFAARNPTAASAARDAAVCLDELISNALKYGYVGGPAGRVTVRASVHADSLQVEICDDARAFDPLAATDPDTEQALAERPIGGLGITIVKQLMDEVSYRRSRGRNRVLLSKRLAAS